jgi:hypothetical protein
MKQDALQGNPVAELLHCSTGSIIMPCWKDWQVPTSLHALLEQSGHMGQIGGTDVHGEALTPVRHVSWAQVHGLGAEVQVVCGVATQIISVAALWHAKFLLSVTQCPSVEHVPPQAGQNRGPDVGFVIVIVIVAVGVFVAGADVEVVVGGRVVAGWHKKSTKGSPKPAGCCWLHKQGDTGVVSGVQVHVPTPKLFGLRHPPANVQLRATFPGPM